MSSIASEKAKNNEELVEVRSHRRRERVCELTRASSEQSKAAEVKVVKGSEAYQEALRKEKPSFKKLVTWQLFGAILLGCFCQTMNGFDVSTTTEREVC